MTEAELEDEPGHRRKRQYTEKAIERIVEQTLYSIPEQATHWRTHQWPSTRGKPHHTVRRILNAHELKSSLIWCTPSSALGIKFMVINEGRVPRFHPP
ncbi:MAG: hypothetical protein ACREX9_07460 [Gammaproteobacteria bacterium]